MRTFLSLPSSRLLAHAHVTCIHGLPHLNSHVRLASSAVAAVRRGSSSHDRDIRPPRAFAGLGLSKFVSIGLTSAFPHIKDATEAQKEFIPALIGGKDVLLKGRTGSGKSFGLVLAILSRYRDIQPQERASVTLLLVPHRDLAFQFLHWIERVWQAAAPSWPLHSIAQVLVRGSSDTSAQVELLHTHRPKIVIGTPQAVFDVLEANPLALNLRQVSAIVVDEADYLIDHVPSEASKVSRQKAEQKMRRHPSATNQLLDRVFAQRIARTRGMAADMKRPRGEDAPERDTLPQLVMCSATFHSGLRQALYGSGWFRKGEGSMVKVKGQTSASDALLFDSGQEDDASVLGGRDIQHCVLVVSEDGDVKNIDGAVEAAPSAELEDDLKASVVEAVFTSPDAALPELSEEEIQRFSMTPSPFHPALMEGIATAFAVDVPRIALLVLPASAPVHRAVYDLRMLGVHAHGLDLLASDRGRAHLLRGEAHGAASAPPTLLVSTLASTRGLDLPALTHVFVLGVPEGRRVDGYVHVAGRVGRCGRGGKVVSVVEARHDVEGADGQVYTKDEPGQMLRILSTLGVAATKYESFY
ncbi:P-loop containing nucleoside triphosphate hydrolase protein [Auriscalpium vulgare]|uniref:P-loop containing nucleoside triphosphate hydrolase protein n=1 Tax=Auriscalpium vulgare TaxID=40419 RepID=A0ACB8SB44_9AGAM|nr:P-loop containing nucleoside triphosphate hydrolase protein [Auriscalpium vulgare]